MKECFGSWQRARSEDQIEQRTDTILQAAGRLLESYRLDEITFAMIGKEAQFTRSNLYRYFKTKEEVFLTMLSRDIHVWQKKALLLIQSGQVTPENFAQTWVDEILKQERLLVLFGQLYTVLEKNVSDECFKEFKRNTMMSLADMITALIQVGLFVDGDKANKFMSTNTSLISGMYAMLTVPERQKKIMSELGYDHETIKSQTTLVEGVQALYEAFRR